MPRTTAPPPLIPAVHPERDALLRAVLAAGPGDDTPALVYADWQDDHGEPEHAEFIRVEQERWRLMSLDPVDGVPESHLGRYQALLRRADQLRRRRRLTRGMPPTAYFVGPFAVGHVRVNKRPGRPAARAPRAWWPTAPLGLPLDRVLRVHLKFNRHADPDLFAAVPRCDWVWRVTHVEFAGGRFGPGAFRALAAAGRLTGLESVWFRRAAVDAAGLAEWVLSASAGRLTDVLLLDGCRVTDPAGRPSPAALAAAVRAVGAGPGATRLRFFSLESREATDEVARAVLESPGLNGLGGLTFAGRRLDRAVRDALEARYSYRLNLLTRCPAGAATSPS